MPSMQTGPWYGNGGQHARFEEFEDETPKPVSLDVARKQLRESVKDMKALKAWAWPGDPRAAPFVAAFRLALATGKARADVYVVSMAVHRFARTTTVDAARKDLQGFIEDMDALKEWADPNTPAWAPLVEAFKSARAKALEAAKRYTTAAGGKP
jgi:hypothetical protein